MNNTSSLLKAFKRVTSLELSKWYMGMLLTTPAETPDTNGAFSLLEATLVPGTEPPPHVHTREDELFYLLEGEFDVYVGEEAFNGKTGECIFLPRFKPHAIIVRSPRLRVLTLFAPAGRKKRSAASVRLPKIWNPPRGRLPIRRPTWSRLCNQPVRAVYGSWLRMRLRANCPCTLNRFH